MRIYPSRGSGISFMACFMLLFFGGNVCWSTIISPSNMVAWIPGMTVGLQRVIPPRTNLIDVTQVPYSADKSGAKDASLAIQSAINAAGSNDVVYFPAGVYTVSNSIIVDKSYITLRGAGATNSLLVGLGPSMTQVIRVGHDAVWATDTSYDRAIASGAVKGSTNLVMAQLTNSAGALLQAGDSASVSESTRNIGSEAFPVIEVHGADRIIKQTVVIYSISGSNVTITSPLAWDFTNQPMLREVSTSGSGVHQPDRGTGIENLGITLTNNGIVGSAAYVIYGSCLQDCWLSGVDVGYAANYSVYLTASANCSMQGCKLHHALSSGSNHAGLLVDTTSGLLVENCIFSDGLQPGIEFNQGVMGCAFFANFFANNAYSWDVDCHNTHPAMNLFEGNVLSRFEMDGYFGSASHQTLLRNAISGVGNGVVQFKRFVSQMNVVGNVVGNTSRMLVYSQPAQAGQGAFELGYPNIGNLSYISNSPPLAWNYPGNSYITVGGQTWANGIFTFTNTQVNTTNLVGWFANVEAPTPGVSALIFQDSANTNQYYSLSARQYSAGTSSNLFLTGPVTVSNGWTLFVSGQNAYQQLQSGPRTTNILHGNLVYTNAIGVVVWDASISDHSIPVSLLYTNGAPSWWGTNRWPAIDPIDLTPVTMIPAQQRYLGIPSGTLTQSSQLTPPSGFHIVTVTP